MSQFVVIKEPSWSLLDVGIKAGDVVEILYQQGNNVYVRSPRRNIKFARPDEVDTDYFAFASWRTTKWDPAGIEVL